jgi:polyferredoxin
MKITQSIRRSIAATLLTAGLVYPACAAVCPKGIGGCTSPGRCFLFVDADGNSLCDYTSRTGSATASGIPSRPGTSSQVSSSAQVTTTPVPDPTTVSSTISPASVTQAAPLASSQDATQSALGSASSSSYGGFPASSFLLEAALFLVFTGILFCLVRRGIFGVRVEKTLPALALSSLFGLGLSLIATALITGSAVAGTSWALIYMSAGTLLAGYLWYTGMMTRKIVLGLAALGTLSGFVFLAPIMPMELGGIINVMTGTSGLTIGIIVICSIIVLALVLGRTFCGNICPVGSLQELAYAIPTPKIVIKHTENLELVRLVVFIATVTAAIYVVDLLEFTGLYDFFSLTLSLGFVVAAAIILLSVFVYRPVCRALCPFGVLFSIAAEFSLFRVRRSGTCIGCRKCEKACPAQTAGREDGKRECYLCGRCTDTCPVEKALTYRR